MGASPFMETAPPSGLGPACGVERLPARVGQPSWPVPPFDGFVPIVSGEGADFVAARRDAHRVCAAHVQEQVASALRSLNERTLSDIAACLRESTRRVQRAWGRDSCPPYVELPAAWVHTGCHSADLPEVLTHLRRHMRPVYIQTVHNISARG